MADFNEAVKLTLQHEGGFVNNPDDPGGATNMGIEQRDLPNLPIASLTVSQAVIYYQDTYWKPLYSHITSQRVANKLFDLGVLFGVGTATSFLQEAARVKQDGIFGPDSLHAINKLGDELLPTYRGLMQDHVTRLITRNPKLDEFSGGWRRRIDS